MRFLNIARIVTLAALAVFLKAVPAQAAPSLGSDSFEIGLEGQYYQYRETDFAKLQGYGGGLDGTYTYTWKNYFLKANVIADYYDLDYSSNGTGSQTGIADYKVDFRGLFGYNFKINKGLTVSPYTGFGYRVLFDTEGDKLTSTNAIGYDRRSEYLYVPIGVGVGFRAGSWAFRTFGEYDYLVQGYQTTYLRDLGFDQNLTNHQNVGYGIRGNFLVTPPLNFYNFSFGPYVRYWNIHDSDIQSLSVGGIPDGGGLEPANNTLEYGLEATIRFQ